MALGVCAAAFPASAKGGKPCLFLHGLGSAGPKGAPLVARPFGGGTVNYWGNLQAELSGVCSAILVVNETTVGTSWTDSKLQTTYYDRAREVVSGGGVVFAHGMANLVLAGACQSQGKCDVRWYGLGGPFRGARAADAGPATDKLVPGQLPDALSPKMAGLAPSVEGSLASVVYQKKLLLGAACGTSAWGSGGVAGAALKLVNALTYGLAPGKASLIGGDGIVGGDECTTAAFVTPNGAVTTVPWGPFSAEPESAFFTFGGNHYDLTGTSGNHEGYLDWMRAQAAK